VAGPLHHRCTTADPVEEPGAPRDLSRRIDHFGNRRIRTVGELIQNQLRTGLWPGWSVWSCERMTTQDVEGVTPQSLISIRPVVAALKEFFGTSQPPSSWTRPTRSRG
jgi:DNA-directed RNA polymerase beta subunit